MDRELTIYKFPFQLGVSCLFDPWINLEVMSKMKTALEAQGLKPHLMTQPLGFRTPDAGPYGWVDIPEFPYGILSWLY